MAGSQPGVCWQWCGLSCRHTLCDGKRHPEPRHSWFGCVTLPPGKRLCLQTHSHAFSHSSSGSFPVADLLRTKTADSPHRTALCDCHWSLKLRQWNINALLLLNQQMHLSAQERIRSKVNLSVGYLQVTGILSWIVRSWTDVENNIVSVERVNEYADTPKEASVPTAPTQTHHSSKHKIQHEKTKVLVLTLPYCLMQASWSIEGSSLPPDWPQRGTIEFQDYGLQYRKGLELALKGITLQVHERERVSHFVSFNHLTSGCFAFLVLCCIHILTKNLFSRLELWAGQEQGSPR